MANLPREGRICRGRGLEGVDDIVDLVLSRKPTCGSTRVLAVDGPAGSGKTTLGGRVCDELTSRGHQAVLVHMDDLYDGWTALDGSRGDDSLTAS